MMLNDTLKRMEVKHRRPVSAPQSLPVYYGWAKINRGQRREALTVIFLNEHPGPRVGRDGQDGVTKWIVPAYKRLQTETEMKDAADAMRTYTSYSIFMDEKHIRGSLDAALKANFDADANHVSEPERTKIREALRRSYLDNHHGYKEPVRQLEFDI